MCFEKNRKTSITNLVKFEPINYYIFILISFLCFYNIFTLSAQESGISFITKAVEKYRKEWDLDGAIVDLRRALSTGLSKQYKIQAYRVLAICYAENDEFAKAVNAFGNLLKLDPAFKLDGDASPTIRNPFEVAKNPKKNSRINSMDSEPPELYDLTQGPIYEGSPFIIKVRAADNTSIKRVAIAYQSGNVGKQTRAQMTEVQNNIYEYTIPIARKDKVSYAIAAWDNDGNKAFLRDKNGNTTKSVNVITSARNGSKKKFYKIAGVAIIGGITTIVLNNLLGAGKGGDDTSSTKLKDPPPMPGNF